MELKQQQKSHMVYKVLNMHFILTELWKFLKTDILLKPTVFQIATWLINQYFHSSWVTVITSVPARVFCSRLEASDVCDWINAGGWTGMCCFWIQLSNASCRPGWCSNRLKRWAAVTLSKGLVLVLRSRATCSKDCSLSGSYTDKDKRSYSFKHFSILVSESYFHTDLESHCCGGQFL